MISILEKTDELVLRQLLAVGYECEQLDYKLTLAYSWKKGRKREALRLIKDVVAMANTDGGFIVFGVRDGSDATFEPVGLDPEETMILTTERLQSWLGKYVEPNLEVASVSITLEGRLFVIVRVERSRIPVPFKTRGWFRNKDGKESVVFSEGEIIVRHGASNHRATYLDMMRFFERVRDEERSRSAADGNGQGQKQDAPLASIPSQRRFSGDALEMRPS